MAKVIFITATGTDIGKTYVAALLVKKMRNLGLNCGYFKPVLSGAKNINGILVPEDAKYVIDNSGLNVLPSDCVSYCFEDAVSPHLAAKLKGIIIDKSKILEDYNKHMQHYDYLVVEGAGGITCPLVIDERSYLLSELIKDMIADVIIVADAGLGTINSVLLTVEYAKKQNIGIKGIVLNNYNDNFMCRDNKETIEKLTGIDIIATVQNGDTDIDIGEFIFNE